MARSGLPAALEARESQLHTFLIELVFAFLPLSIQAITLPALSKAWKQWAEEHRAKERALEQAKGVDLYDPDADTDTDIEIFDVPLRLAQRQHDLTDEEKRRFQLRAVAHGDVGAVVWFGLASVGVSPYTQQRWLCESAAFGGQLKALQWLRELSCDWDAETCSAAAGGGHLGVLQWARANGCEWDARTCSEAAHGGHLAVLQWARANGYEWDARSSSDAAHGGHLGVLQWARANGCDWDASTCWEAAFYGHLGVLQWARANGCAWNRDECLELAERNGPLAMLQWPQGNGGVV
jgi:hypothetical protein